MRLSKYNLYDKKEHIVYNGLTKKIVKLGEYDWKLLEKQVELKSEIKDPITALMKENGFYTEENELELIKEKLKKNIYQSDILMITIVVTKKCNFRCQYCYEEFSDECISDEEEKAIYQYILRNIDSYKGVEIGWFGGEPLLELVRIKRMTATIAAICVKKGKTFNAGMTTNGYLLTQETFNQLLRIGVRSFHVTLDGMREQHDITRRNTNGNGTFDKIFENLKQIWNCELNDKINFKFTVRINISKANVSSIEHFFEVLAEHIAYSGKFGVQIALVEDYGGTQIGKFRDNILTVDKLNYFRGMALDKGLMVHDLEDLLFSNFGAMCYAEINSHITIVPNGGIIKCTVKLEEMEHRIGVIENIIKVDEEKKAKWSNRKIIKKCEECKYLPLCFGGGCPLKNNIMNEYKCPSHFWENSLENLLGKVCLKKMIL